MISSKKLIKMAKKWQHLAALKRKRISLPGASRRADQGTPSLADKGHFIVYTVDERRFAFPVTYLNNPLIIRLFEMSKEEFGLTCDGPIRLPCDAVFMEYVISLIKRNATKDIETALLMSMTAAHCLPISHLHHEPSNCQSLICGF